MYYYGYGRHKCLDSNLSLEIPIGGCEASDHMLLYCRLPGDKIDIWLCRYNGLGPANFWGFKQLSYR